MKRLVVTNARLVAAVRRLGGVDPDNDSHPTPSERHPLHMEEGAGFRKDCRSILFDLKLARLWRSFGFWAEWRFYGSDFDGHFGP